MCVTTKHIDKLQKFIDDMISDKEALRNKLSEIDRSISELYHQIESSSFNAYQGYLFSKELQESLRKRRVIKSELHRMFDLERLLKNRGVFTSVSKARDNVDKSCERFSEWQQNWNYTYTLDELIH
jgi:uncharacterized protein YukE